MELINNIPSIVVGDIYQNMCQAYQVVDDKLELKTIHISSCYPMTIEERQEFFIKLIKLGYYYTSDNDRILKLPKAGTEYHYIYIDRGSFVGCTQWTGNQHDIERFAIGNCFLDIESAYDAVSTIKNPFVNNIKKFEI